MRMITRNVNIVHLTLEGQEDLYQELSKPFLNCIDKFLIDVTEKGPKRD
ncbi:MAG: hypothetical protein ACLTQG_00355 [Hungatella sp.]|uniref:Uncharacterized protein n=1 Tax=Hungatella hathewayi DSM 13479 TaxID=566550 RepID=D3AKD0_9FIRM|nr:hypothetical protein CLOSTHATH_04073 [Hungatella hathewayi DSM 13479]